MPASCCHLTFLIRCISHSSSHALLHVTLSPSPPTPYPISLVQKELAFSARGSYFYSNNTLENLSSSTRRRCGYATFTEAFAGRAKLVPRCRYCLAETHSSQECPHSPAETAGGADGRPTRPLSRPQGSSGTPASSVDICRLYNSPGGLRCRYAHLCSRCRRPHSLAECGERARQQPTAVPSSGQPAPPQATGGSMPHTT